VQNWSRLKCVQPPVQTIISLVSHRRERLDDRCARAGAGTQRPPVTRGAVVRGRRPGTAHSSGMSRLIVKGLPKRYEEKHVRELFSAVGDVTDARVMRTADGRSRQFAFVGFRSAAEAARARQRLDRTFVDAAQVSVEVARAVGDDNIVRPWSKYSKGSSAHAGAGAGGAGAGEGEGDRLSGKKERGERAEEGKREEKEGSKAERGGGASEDAAFCEFRGAVAKRGKAPLWTDSSRASVRKSLVASRKAGGEGKMLERSHVVFGDDGSDADGEDVLYEELPGSAAGEKTEEKGEEGDSQGASDAQQVVEGSAEVPLPEDSSPAVAADDENVNDADYFRSKVRSRLDDEEVDGEESGEDEAGGSDRSSPSSSGSGSDGGSDLGAANDGAEAGAGKSGDEAPPTTRKEYDLGGVDVSETGRLFVRNLAFSVTVDDLETLFEPFGAIADVHLVQDPRTKKSRGVAFVLYVVPENAAKALAAMDRTIVHGRLLHVLPGKPRPAVRALGSAGAAAPGSNPFKEGRETARKASARTGADANAFNAMFLSTDAVAGVMADRYGVSKADVYGTGHGESGSAAVRLAAGEARLQAETREYFLANGVDMDVAQAASGAERRKKLSRTAFLVKNLPARTGEEELDGLFGKFGTLDRLLLASPGLLAVVVYVSANDAKKAYASLAYTRLKDAPLYLEWLAADAIVGSASHSAKSKTTAATAAEDVVRDGGEHVPAAGVDEDGGGGLAESLPQVSVFVKNLNFDTRDEALRKHILKVLRRQPQLVAALRAATVATRPNPKDPAGPRLSYGYGFAEFATARDAGEAVKVLQGSQLDGHTLELRMANRPAGASERESGNKRSRSSSCKRKPTPKLMIRNIAFEATSRDVKSLFGTFGQVKSIRIPRKQDGSHRGFGFVEFVSKNEATAALAALAASHLYGRHLVIDYADATVDGCGSVEELQAKAAKQVAKRRRIDGGVSGDGVVDVEPNDDDAQMMDEMYG
jgi:multiple RNA-binding domain-containing protein 1